jgi:signal transduction histidine kinase
MRMRPPRFFRRFALVAAFGLMCLIVGFVTLVSLAIGRSMLFAIGVLVAVAVMAMISGMFRRVGRPLDAVMDAADRVAGGDYAVRVGEQGPPPIRALARAFNTMTERLQNHDRLRRNLMADVAHELRTPLTVIQGKLEGLLDGVYPRDERQLQQLLDETHVLSRLIEDLRTLALSESGALKLEKDTIDLAALASDVAGAFAGDAAERHVTIAVDAAADLPSVEADPVRIREVVGNLLSNALRHTPAAGSVVVRLASSNGHVSVDVRDSGRGMTREEIERAFDRFYKGPESRGSGLGLTIAKSLVAAHGGEMQASSEPGRGTTIGFTLPRS